MILRCAIFFSFSLLCLNLSIGQINDVCSEMEPFCPNPGLTFTANCTGIDAMFQEPGNDYGCLFSAPNPTWYYCLITQSGSINMNLYAASDIDYIIYGPFSDTTQAVNACGQMGNGLSGGNIVDCSYSATNDEYPEILAAVVDEVYVVLITNYANIVQDLTITQISGTGEANCTLLPNDPCLASPGTSSILKNGLATNSPVLLSVGDSFEIFSNGDYSLPLDTIPIPFGDGIYSAQLMWLIYDQFPTFSNPSTDPGFLNEIIADSSFSDVNSSLSPIIDDHGCGTYWFVPVTADDGIGGNNNVANLSNDNGGLHWDRDGNGCYEFGTPVEVEYACAMQLVETITCNSSLPVNKIDIEITGGIGDYTIINFGQGDLLSPVVLHNGSAVITNLENGDFWEIEIIDENGVSMISSGTFLAPVFNSVVLTPAVSCPSFGNGTVDVMVNGSSGNGGPYTIYMASDPATAGTVDSYSDVSGTLVNIKVFDNEGCYTDSIVTIPSSGHFINVSANIQNETCFGEGDGFALINAIPTPSGNITNITWTGPSGQHPGGNPGGPANSSQGNLETGIWTIEVEDDFGCSVSVAIEIESPQQLIAYSMIDNNPSCFGFADGNISCLSTGGVPPYVITYSTNNPSPGNSGLLAGTYIVYVTDQNSCLDSTILILTEPDSLYFTLLGGDDNTGIMDGSVYSLADGGMPLYNYAWTNLNDLSTHSNSTWSDLTGGDYQITVTDAIGCQIIDTVSIGNLSMEDLIDEIRVFPNPIVNGVMYVQTEFSGFELLIFNMRGELVFSQKILSGENVLQLQLVDGVYSFELRSNLDHDAKENPKGKLIFISK